MSIHQDISNCSDVSDNDQHIFLPVYLDNNNAVLDNSQNSTTILDSSYNFLLNAVYTNASHLRQMISYKNKNESYSFKYNLSYKNLLNVGLKNDIEGTSITMVDGSFNSGHTPVADYIGKVYVQYIADTLIGHPLAQAFISNEGSIINDINSSNIHVQFTNAMVNGLTTTTFSTNDICKSIIIQMKKLMVDRFEDEVADTEYQLPFCPGDKISIFIRMKCNITLDNLVGSYTNTSEYEMLKNMFENRDDVNFNDVDSSMTLSEKVWRIKIKLI
tara:strand:+ start:1481 stop:2299 length:819 start_codon:yes stop_codon:yes gene_type:complete